MIYLIGFGSEGTFRHTCNKLHSVACIIDLDLLLSNQNTKAVYKYGVLSIFGCQHINITFDDALYHRVFIRQEADAGVAHRLQNIYDCLEAFCLDAPISNLIINRLQASTINQSKPAQLMKLRDLGFRVPTTLVSNYSDEIAAFAHDGYSVISKGLSGLRTEAATVNRSRLDSLPKKLDSPLLVQQYIDGFDVRAHFVGLEYVAQKIDTDYVDYRYAERQGYLVKFDNYTLPSDLYLKCLDYMNSELQEFAAFDFRVEENMWYLLEANPMPGYSYFDRRCDGKISAMICRYLQKGYSNLMIQKLNECFIETERRHPVDVGTAIGRVN